MREEKAKNSKIEKKPKPTIEPETSSCPKCLPMWKNIYLRWEIYEQLSHNL